MISVMIFHVFLFRLIDQISFVVMMIPMIMIDHVMRREVRVMHPNLLAIHFGDVFAALELKQLAALAAAAVLSLSSRRNVKTVEELKVLLQDCKYSIDPGRRFVPPVNK